ncbi:hypothetical protein NX786_20210 [Telluria mixta]|uniref:Bacterial transcriptional activator domain-containing protein n=1 Tax=Telluria mixta TaxID=34071 RepID=A0ABT2C4S9_9BURK|nr:hypothetical protein [Telluria mixta]MCS0631654.1 hypothetical protein [Telluria mixta]WEM98404.1 hypothetical protein P0M04_12060 [Telluria mixta]
MEDANNPMPALQEPYTIGIVARLWHRLTGDRKGRLRDERIWIALPRKIKDACRIVPLHSAEDFLEALAALACNTDEREIYLRRRLWWAWNDKQRLGKNGPLVLTPYNMLAEEALFNMRRLLQLVECAPSQQVERGELLRQLGRFDEAVAILKAVPADGHNEIRALKIEKLARSGDTQVQELSPQTW